MQAAQLSDVPEGLEQEALFLADVSGLCAGSNLRWLVESVFQNPTQARETGSLIQVEVVSFGGIDLDVIEGA
jgi:hypothetical protein